MTLGLFLRSRPVQAMNRSTFQNQEKIGSIALSLFQAGLFCLFSLIFAIPAFAEDIEHIPMGACEASLLFPDRLSGIGERGYLGSKPAPTPEILEAATKLALMKWNVKIFPVRSLAEAQDLNWLTARIADLQINLNMEELSTLKGDDLVQAGIRAAKELIRNKREVVYNPLMTGLYIIAPEVDLTTMTDTEAQAFMASIPSREIYEIDENGVVTKLDSALVAERFDSKSMVRTKYFAQEPIHIRQDGWFFPKVRGILRVNTMNRATSKTYGKLEKRLRADIKRDNLEFTFNQDMTGVMRGAMLQQRRGQEVQNNRVTEQSIEDFLRLQADGLAVSIETWQRHEDGTRELVAGTFGTLRKGVLELDSIFYPPGKVDYARYLFLMARDRLIKAGMEFIDGGMVSPFTRQMKGAYVSAEEFIELLDSRDQNAKPDLTTPWPN
jgi:Leu/Phe-tRNA-protein transferase